MNKLLLDEPPLIVLPTLASVIGLNESLFLQQLHYWLLKSTTIFDNQKWVYKTIEEWEKEFPFWSNSTLKRTINSLKKKNILIVKKLQKNRINHYTILYKNLKIIEPKQVNLTSQNEPQKEVNMNPLIGQNEPFEQFNMNHSAGQNDPFPIYNENQRDYTETITENTQDIFFKKSSSQKSKKITWEQVEKKEKILAEIKKVESPLLPIEQFVNSLIQHGYKYVDFVKAYQVWVSRAKSKIEEKKTPVENRELTATEIIAMRKKELGL